MKRGLSPLVGICVAALVGGCGSTKTLTQTVSTTDSVTTTNTQTIARTTVTQPARTVHVTETRTQTHTVTQPPTATHSFSGNGGKNLGTITLSQTSTIHWTNDGQLFQLFISNGSGDYSINSQAHSGTSVLPAGSYPNVQANADGNWTIQIVPGG